MRTLTSQPRRHLPSSGLPCMSMVSLLVQHDHAIRHTRYHTWIQCIVLRRQIVFLGRLLAALLDNLSTVLLVFLLRDPHLVECAETS